MDNKMVDITLHVDESLSNDELEHLRDALLARNGVLAADFQEKTPHLIVVEYNPDIVNSSDLLKTVLDRGTHAELVGL